MLPAQRVDSSIGLVLDTRWEKEAVLAIYFWQSLLVRRLRLPRRARIAAGRQISWSWIYSPLFRFRWREGGEEGEWQEEIGVAGLYTQLLTYLDSGQ